MVIKTLDELGIEHVTDKATIYPGSSVHGYTTMYDTILTPLRDKPIRMLEIGICMEGSSGGHSVRMWRDYFSKASLYTFDIVDMSELINSEEFKGRAHFFQGDQESRQSMSDMYNQFLSPDNVVELPQFVTPPGAAIV